MSGTKTLTGICHLILTIWVSNSHGTCGLKRLTHLLKVSKQSLWDLTAHSTGYYAGHSAWQGTSLVAQMVKHLPTIWETWVRSLAWKDPLEKEMATHSRTLTWKSPWMEEPGRLQSRGRKESDTTERLQFTSAWQSGLPLSRGTKASLGQCAKCRISKKSWRASCKTFPDPLDREYKEMKKQTNRIWRRRL